MIQKFKDLVKYSAIAAPVYAALAIPAFADSGSINLSAPGQWSNLGNLSVGGIVSGAISLVMIVVALVFFFMLIWGGLRWVMSEGDEKAVTAARNQITNALIGLAIVFAAFAIMKLIDIVFNINLLGNLTIPTFNQ